MVSRFQENEGVCVRAGAVSEERKESDAGSGSGCVLTVFVSGDSGCSSEAARRIGADSGKRRSSGEILQSLQQVA